jgi:hypothetical protein
VRIVWDTMKSALEPDEDRAGGRTDRGENAIAGQAWLLLSLGHDGIMNGRWMQLKRQLSTGQLRLLWICCDVYARDNFDGNSFVSLSLSNNND